MIKYLTMENCIFCKVIKNQIPSFKVWEDEKALAFLTIKPLTKGHLLLIPKIHEDYFFDLDDETIKDLSVKAKPLAHALKKIFKPRSGKIAMSLMGIGIPHVHIHLFPLNSEDDADPKKAYQASEKELLEVQEKIKKALEVF